MNVELCKCFEMAIFVCGDLKEGGVEWGRGWGVDGECMVEMCSCMTGWREWTSYSANLTSWLGGRYLHSKCNEEGII